MFKINPKQIILKQPSKFDYPGFAPPERRKEILQNTLYVKPKLLLMGGTSKTNPYKHHFDVILAERRESFEYYKNSILWSPKYTPYKFKNYFFYPALLVLFLMLYIRYIAVPKKMMRLKKIGFDFPNLEEKGYLNDWIEDDEEDDDYDEFSEAKAELQGYKDWTIKDLENFDRKQKINQSLEVKQNSDIQQTSNKLQNTKIKNMKNKLQTQLDQTIQIRQELGLNKN